MSSNKTRNFSLGFYFGLIPTVYIYITSLFDLIRLPSFVLSAIEKPTLAIMGLPFLVVFAVAYLIASIVITTLIFYGIYKRSIISNILGIFLFPFEYFFMIGSLFSNNNSIYVVMIKTITVLVVGCVYIRELIQTRRLVSDNKQATTESTTELIKDNNPTASSAVNNQTKASYFSKLFTGRLNRRNYWVGLLLYLLIPTITIVSYFLLPAYTLTFSKDLAQAPHLKTNTIFSNIDTTLEVISTIYLIIFFPTIISLYVRRLHDLSKNGWNLLIGLVPIVGPLYLAFAKGASQENKHGKIPLSRINIQSDILNLS